MGTRGDRARDGGRTPTSGRGPPGHRRRPQKVPRLPLLSGGGGGGGRHPRSVVRSWMSLWMEGCPPTSARRRLVFATCWPPRRARTAESAAPPATPCRWRTLLHDLQDRLSDVFTADRSSGAAGSAVVTRSHPGWPIEPADLFVVDPGRPVAVSTLGDPDLARSVIGAGHPAVGVAGPTATENIGVEKIVRNVLAAPGIRVLILAGPETGGTAPTGHYAGDALCALHERGVEPETMRIRGARGRRPFVKNLAPAEVTAFQRQVRLVDLRGEADLVAVLAAVDAVVASWPAALIGPGDCDPGRLDPRCGRRAPDRGRVDRRLSTRPGGIRPHLRRSCGGTADPGALRRRASPDRGRHGTRSRRTCSGGGGARPGGHPGSRLLSGARAAESGAGPRLRHALRAGLTGGRPPAPGRAGRRSPRDRLLAHLRQDQPARAHGDRLLPHGPRPAPPRPLGSGGAAVGAQSHRPRGDVGPASAGRCCWSSRACSSPSIW